ncbi:ABC transporter ATP-binding protein [Tessaracoccus sp. OS52]|uniref:ABC transporter ATP-binding protein n=1 Tax=Tessaracoccus sp. OS52 TaxID=2886691 RepID=UPI001D12C2A6|nr:ABC transporter ATP-binding protein [Tessaracoccus sp. OS52]
MNRGAIALRGRNLHRTFGSGQTAVRALRGVEIDVTHGQLTVVTGPSGAGKTTLLNLLCGLDLPDVGEVTLADGQSLSAMPEADRLALRRQRFGYVFQSFGLIPVLSAAENVEVPLRLQRISPAERGRRVSAHLERVGLARHAKQRPGELSGGQQQRVGIARALVTDPDVLVADEPTGQLDSDTATAVMQLIVELTHERGLAAVVSTHDPVMLSLADRRVALLDGAVATA